MERRNTSNSGFVFHDDKKKMNEKTDAIIRAYRIKNELNKTIQPPSPVIIRTMSPIIRSPDKKFEHRTGALMKSPTKTMVRINSLS
jgi:hypothetical protein